MRPILSRPATLPQLKTGVFFEVTGKIRALTFD
jgi:hypothetical protein